MNDAFVRLFSIPDKESFLNGDQHRLFNTPEEREGIIDELIEFHSISNKLISFKHFDESRFWGRLSCTLLEEDGEQFIVGTISDVTIQQEHESMLRESENELREAQRIAKIGNWQLFNTSKNLRRSEECIRIHGFSGEV
jgi:PAS domain-containing protein